MAIARFKDLVLDARDARLLGRFWAQALHLDWHAQGNGDGWLSGATPQHTIWINQVPEPITGKNRVHFDIYATSLAELEAHGATVVEPHSKWTVMADPEGTLFCAFVRDALPRDRLHGLVVDSGEPAPAATWWAGVFDAPVDVHDEDWATVEKIPAMPILTMDFNAVPEPKTAKNRVHWDVEVADVQPLLDAGATLVRPPGGDIDWHVLADPQGNEFCAFTG
jgi:glyoxalase superfamily protein